MSNETLFPHLWYVCSMHVCLCVGLCMWRAKVDVQDHPQLLFQLIHWGQSLSHTQSSLIWLSLSSLLWIVPVSASWGGHIHTLYYVSSGDLTLVRGFLKQVLWPLSCLPSPLHLLSFFLTLLFVFWETGAKFHLFSIATPIVILWEMWVLLCLIVHSNKWWFLLG